jgi:hypothetical protein
VGTLRANMLQQSRGSSSLGELQLLFADNQLPPAQVCGSEEPYCWSDIRQLPSIHDMEHRCQGATLHFNPCRSCTVYHFSICMLKQSCLPCKALASGASRPIAIALYLIFYTVATIGLLVVGDFPKRYWWVSPPWT